MTRCPGCFKPGKKDFCRLCRKRLFGGLAVPFELPFSRPDYNAAKLAITPDRMSISGIQTKISLVLRDGRLAMVEKGGQYVLKPIPHGALERLDLVPINEHLTMQIARQVFKIDVADNALVAFSGGEYAYVVRRFDVLPAGQRLLQEDFAQIAARSEETHGQNYKYDCSYEEIGDLIRQHVAAYKVDLERYFTLVLFNYLVHNGDAHAKNFSLVRNEQTGEYRLSPAYDLLNTRLHLPNESPTALTLFKDDFQTESYSVNAFYAYDDFLTFAQRLGLVESRSQRIRQRIIDAQPATLALIDSTLLPEECKAVYKEQVQDRCRAIAYSYAQQR